jgi:hypothetical protein
LLIHGGFNEGQDFNDLWIFDPGRFSFYSQELKIPVNITWHEIQKPQIAPSARSMHTLTMIEENSFILIGGKDEDDEHSGDVWSLTVTLAGKNIKDCKILWNKLQPFAGNISVPDLACHSATVAKETEGSRYLAIYGGESDGKSVNKLFLLNLGKKLRMCFLMS